MRKRTIIGTLAMAAAAVYIARFSSKVAAEIRRYNHMRSLSDEGPISEDAPELMKQIMRQQGQTVKEWFDFFKSAPKDVARYTKIETL